jgi:hypothetical protein
MTDVLVRMQRCGWRFIEFPITSRKYGFQQEQAKHRYIFRDQQLIESLGAENPTYRYTIPFREDISKGPYRHLFTEVYPEFLNACLDRTRGILSDPVHGDINVKCVSLSEDLDVNKRDGIDVECEWIVAPLESELAQDLTTQIKTLQGAADDARRFDADIKKIDWKQEPPPKATVSPLDFISGIGGQLEVAGGKVTSALADYSFRLEKSVATIDRLKDPNLAPTRQQARRLQTAVLDLEDRTDITGIHPVKKTTSVVNRSFSATAALLGMSVQQFARLNPQFARAPFVKAGSILRSFADTQPPPKRR